MANEAAPAISSAKLVAGTRNKKTLSPPKTYSHRLRALSAWTAAPLDVDEEKRELLLQQLILS